MHLPQPEGVAEVFQVRLAAADVPRFVEGSEDVHLHFMKLDGYGGMEVLVLGDVEVLVILRWQSYTSFDRHLPLILHACALKAWLQLAEQVSHRPALLGKWDPHMPERAATQPLHDGT